jgi:hypothetical protein
MNFLLQQALIQPGSTLRFNNDEYHQLLSEGRCTRLLASLALELQDAGLTREIPPAVNRHLLSAQLVHEKQKRDLAYECEKVQLALNSIGEKLVLLKGAAYLLAELPAGRGRLITDIDIIVPRRRINEAEEALVRFGWERGNISPYDDHYYRKWGHEIPALTNPKRDTTLDVHHNILPPTSGPNVDANLLFEHLIEVKPGIFTLSWQDMVIHSATHLFHEGEFHHGLRDLWDLDRMLRDFPQRDPQFWERLVSRARALELLGSLFHGLVYVQCVFRTPVPESVIEEASNWSRRLRKPLMDFLFLRAFRPNQPQNALPLTGLALNLLYVRAHYLRLPLYLLIPHLTRKAWIRRFVHDAPSLELQNKKVNVE